MLDCRLKLAPQPFSTGVCALSVLPRAKTDRKDMGMEDQGRARDTPTHVTRARLMIAVLAYMSVNVSGSCDLYGQTRT